MIVIVIVIVLYFFLTRIGAAVVLVLVGSYRDAVAMAARVPCALARVRCDEVGHRGGGTDDRARAARRESERAEAVRLSPPTAAARDRGSLGAWLDV